MQLIEITWSFKTGKYCVWYYNARGIKEFWCCDSYLNFVKDYWDNKTINNAINNIHWLDESVGCAYCGSVKENDQGWECPDCGSI